MKVSFPVYRSGTPVRFEGCGCLIHKDGAIVAGCGPQPAKAQAIRAAREEFAFYKKRMAEHTE